MILDQKSTNNRKPKPRQMKIKIFLVVAVAAYLICLLSFVLFPGSDPDSWWYTAPAQRKEAMTTVSPIIAIMAGAVVAAICGWLDSKNRYVD